MKSIRTRMIVVFSAICIGCMLVSMVLVSYIAQKSFVQSSEQFKNLSAEYYASLIDGWLEKETAVIDSSKTYLETSNLADKEDIANYLQQQTSAAEHASDIYVGFDDKSFIDGTGWVPEDDWDCTTRSWYTGAKASGEKVYGEPYVDAITGDMVLGVSKAFVRKDGKQGVVSMDLNLAVLLDMVNQVVDTKDGSYAFLINQDGLVLMHPNEKFMINADQQYTISELVDGNYVKGMESKKAIRDYDGVEKYIKTADVKASGWKVVMAIPVSVYNQDRNQLMKAFLCIMIVCAVIAAIIVALYGLSITAPIMHMKDEITELKELRLEKEKNERKTKPVRKDELGNMKLAICGLRNCLLEIVEQLCGVMATLVEQFENVEGSVENSAENMGSIKETLSQIVAAIEDEAGQSQMAIENLNDFSDELNSVAGNTEKINQIAEKTVAQSMEGVDSIRKLSEQIQQTQALQAKACQTVNELSEKSGSIAGISQTIGSIAEQTSLLSLNASIEAARAGAAGQGFSVVAEEIRELSDETATATDGIAKIITEVQTKITAISQQMDTIQGQTNECIQAMGQTQDIFRGINTDITGVGEEIYGLEKAVNGLNMQKNNIVHKFSDISSETQKISSSSQQIYGKVEQQNEEIEVMGNALEKLKKVVENLGNITNQFQIVS
ncbi:MAG: methyl-accepting chemotaxis protein [Lachnospiraceae bacterium]